MKKKHIIIILCLLPAFVFMAEEHSSSNFLPFLGKSLNFIILFGGLSYLLSKPLQNFLKKRSLEIKQSLEEAENRRQEAEE